MTKTLRGQQVEIDNKRRTLNISILKPLGDLFSLSDRIIDYLIKDYAVVVNLPTTTKRLTYHDNPVRREVVRSKFPNSPDWHRYWFRFERENGNQIKLF